MSQSQSINSTATLEPSGPDHIARSGATTDDDRQHQDSNNIYSNPDLAFLGTLEADSFIRTEPAWEDHRHDSNWAVASVNVNSLPPHATSAEEIGRIMTHLRLDVLAIQETKKHSPDMEKLRKQLAFNGWQMYFTSVADNMQAQKGVAVVLSTRASLHYLGHDTIATTYALTPEERAMQAQSGTGLRVRLAYARAAQLHIVALYVPPGRSNNATREHTQRVASAWIQQISSNGHKAIVLGDFNERLADGGANVSTIRRALLDRELFEETHRHVRHTLLEGTSVSRGGAPRSWIDFIFVTTNLGSGVRQAVVAIESTELNEDHRLIAAEVAVSLGQPGAASQVPARRPRLNIAGATEAQQLAFLAKLDKVSVADTDIDSFIWKTAEGAFQKMSARRKAAQLKSRLCRASQMRKHVWRYMGGEDLQRWRWGKIVEECDKLITDGLPTAIREKCREVASILPPPNWEGAQKTLTNYIRKRLSKTVTSEAARRHYRKIAKATHRRAELMNGQLGRMVRSLRRGAMAPRLARVVIQTPDGTEIYTDPERVEAEASRHFATHFTHPNTAAILVTEAWTGEYQARTGPGAGQFGLITVEELDEWIDRTPRGKAPGPSGVPFELIRLSGTKFRAHLLALFNKALESAEIPPSWTRGLLIPIPKKPDANGDLRLYRPITLLEVTRKLLTMILTSRMETALRPMLMDTNLAFQRNKRATDLGMLLQQWAELCIGEHRKLLLLLLDVAKAYDSVRPELLQMSLERLGVPPNITALIMRLHDNRRIEVVTAHGAPVPFVQQCGLAQGDALSPLLWIIVYDPLLSRIHRERMTLARQRQTGPSREEADLELPEVRIAAVAYADDLTLVGTSCTDLQETMDITASWFEMVGVTVNTSKTELVEWPRPDPSEGALLWGTGPQQQQITQSPGDREPTRVLGQYIVPDGHKTTMVNFLKATATTLAANLAKKWIFGRIAQYMYRAVLCPLMSYKMQGAVLTEADTTAIQAPMIAMVKQKFGVPSTTPSSFWFTRAGGRLPRMRAEYERRATEMTVRFRNGDGSTECGNLARHMEQHARIRLRFPGDPLAYPDHATAVTLSSAGQLWWPNMAQILAKRGLNIRTPVYGDEEDRSILAILAPGWAGAQDARAYMQMHEHGIRTVSDALELDGGTLKVRGAGYRLFWERKLRTLVAAQARPRVANQRQQQQLLRAGAARLILSPGGNEQGPKETPFLPSLLEEKFAHLDIASRATQATQVDIFTDGSLIPAKKKQAATMGFAAIFVFQRAGARPSFAVLSGATRNGPYSSTTAEIMAIAAALSVLPQNIPATIWCDSQAAIAMTRKLQNAADDSWSKSPLAYVAQFFIPRIRQRTAALRLKWIPGHKGNEGNEAADKAAKNAQGQEQGWWSFRLGAPPERPFWVCAGNSLAPYKIGGIVKRQEEAWAAGRLVKRVRFANGDAEIRESDLKETLEALNWSANSNGTWTRKNSWCQTNARDSNLRGFVLGAMFNVLPVAEREWAWYPQAYEGPEWKTCPCCNDEIETQEHYFACTASRLILGPGVTVTEPEAQSTPRSRANTGQAMAPRADRWTMVRPSGPSATAEFANADEGVEEMENESDGPVAQWIERVAKTRTASVLIPRQWRLETANVIVREMAQYGEKGRDWASRSLACDKELKSAVQWQRILRKIAIRKRWAHEYQEHWLPRNDAQISKEEASTVRPKKRRALMRQPRPPDGARKDSTPVYPRETEAWRLAEYKKLCQVLMDDWRSGRKSSVQGKGLWSINTRYS